MAIQKPEVWSITKIFHLARRSHIAIIGLFFLILHSPANFFESDVAGARDNFSNNYRTDFQGAVQTLTYGLLPDFVISWSTWLLFIQILCTTLGLIFLKRNINLGNTQKSKIVYITLVYVTLSLSTQGTRDGTMTSLAILGIGLYLESLRKKSPQLLTLSILTLIWAGSLRPWVSFAIPVFIFAASKVKLNSDKKAKLRTSVARILITVIFGMTCISVESTLTEVLGLNSSYPEQQVMVMDLTASYCWGNNPTTALKALTALASFYTDEQFKSNVCQFFRPDTWASLRDSKYASTSSVTTNFSLIKPEDKARYQNLREGWTSLVMNDPVTYLQGKLIFASKLLIGSDSREVSRPSIKKLFSGEIKEYKNFFKQLSLLPFQVIISLHLLSILFSTLFVLAVLMRQKTDRPIYISYTLPILFVANIAWLSLTAIAYIGSNGRYLYLPSLLVFTLTYFNYHRNKAHT